MVQGRIYLRTRHSRFFFFFFLMIRRPPISTLFPYPPLSRSPRRGIFFSSPIRHSSDKSYFVLAATVPALESGFTTTCRAYCKSMDWTCPVWACHWAKLSTSILYLPEKSPEPK